MMVDFELGEYIRTFSSQSHRWLSGTVEPPLTAISLQEPLFFCNGQIIHTLPLFKLKPL